MTVRLRMFHTLQQLQDDVAGECWPAGTIPIRSSLSCWISTRDGWWHESVRSVQSGEKGSDGGVVSRVDEAARHSGDGSRSTTRFLRGILNTIHALEHLSDHTTHPEPCYFGFQWSLGSIQQFSAGARLGSQGTVVHCLPASH